MKLPAAAAMLAHYFGGMPLDAKQREKLGAALEASPTPVTPAVVEQLCARHETVDELLDALAEQAVERAAVCSSPEETAGTAGAGKLTPQPLPLVIKRQVSGPSGG